MKISLLFLILLMFSFQILSADDSSGNENFGLVVETKPPKPEIPPCSTKLDCTSHKNAFKGREYTKLDNYKKAEKYYKKHLKKHKDPAVLAELAKLYEIQKKYYLAGLAFKEAGMPDEFNRIEQLRLKNFKEKGSPKVWESAKKQSELFEKAFVRKKATGIVLTVIGGITVLSGLAASPMLFVYTPAVMIGGMGLLGRGLFLNNSANYSLNVSSAFNKISLNYYDEGDDALQYYETSGEKEAVKRLTARSLKNHAKAFSVISAVFISSGLISLAVGLAHSRSDEEEDEDDEDNQTPGIWFPASAFEIIIGASLLGAGGVSLIGGAIMLVKSSAWSRKVKPETFFTLNSIAPMIDPVSKTYGLSIGFSF